jgi:hypothetical protein
MICVSGTDFARLRLYWAMEQPWFMVGVSGHDMGVDESVEQPGFMI